MLSATEFAEIVSALGKGDTVDPVHKNRRALRVQHNGKMHVFRMGIDPSEATLAVSLRDISARGCSFTCKSRLNAGSNFVIQFARNNQSPAGMLCTVVYCRPTSLGYRIGAEFTCSLEATKTARDTDSSDLDRIRNSILT